jgi:type III restriction enzyme
MELKSYQRQVIKDLEDFLTLQMDKDSTSRAYRQFWEDRIGPYDPLEQTGMRPYQNNVPGATHLAIKVPTAGGKTFIAVNALRTIFDVYPEGHPRAVVWLVPWSNLLDQTVNALRNLDHPYRRKLNALFNHRVVVYEKKDLLQGTNFSPATVRDQLSIVVMSFASLRAKNKDDRKVYQENGQLASFATNGPAADHLMPDTDQTALINVIRSLRPVLVVDESHNAESALSVEMLTNLNPSFILDLTATPKQNSNIISIVPAIELKRENMVKLPVIIYNHNEKAEVIQNAVNLRRKLESLAQIEHKKGGRYIRPIVLFQAEPKTKDDNVTFDRVKQLLISIGIPAEEIKIKTSDKDELKGIDLQHPDSPVRYIITVNALREGWDCPFAYVLASLANRSSAVDVEQILGRVLRQPYVTRHESALLNVSFVLTSSAKFNETLENVVASLQAAGFSAKDYRQKDLMTEETRTGINQPKKGGIQVPGETNGISPANTYLGNHRDDDEDDFDFSGIVLQTSHAAGDEELGGTEEDEVLRDITMAAIEKNTEMQAQADAPPPANNIYSGMEDRVKRYRILEKHREAARGLSFPQFFIEPLTAGTIFSQPTEQLHKNILLKDFKLSQEDTRIDFTSIDSQLYEVDINEDNDDRPAYRLIDDANTKDKILEYILAKPREGQIKDVRHRLLKSIGNLYPISDREIGNYLTNILNGFTEEQLSDVVLRELLYVKKIKQKINRLSAAYAEKSFNELVTISRIKLKEKWQLHEAIVPGKIGPSLTGSLYEREGNMNVFEEKIIGNIASFENIVFWHRNLERGKGFSINGFINHYPDFILYTKRGNVILLETKGDHLDGSDSEQKARLGTTWARLAGDKFNYFMVFDQSPVPGAFSLADGKRLIREL